MIEPHCLGPDVDRARIAPDAQVTGSSYISGARTNIDAGAIVHSSRIHNAAIARGAEVEDSIFIAEGETHRHKCDTAGRVTVQGAAEPRVDADAHVRGCTMVNSSVGANSSVVDTWAKDCQLGDDNHVARAKLILVNSGLAVTITGPTEVSEAHLGHHTTIDQRGYFEGVFSNRFLRLRFDESAQGVIVKGEIDLPHVSRYGFNTVNSTNSGKSKAQPQGVLRGFGAHVGGWHDTLLSHEQIQLGPCCWVAPWTKVIGQSARAHADDAEMVSDTLMTYVMPFALAGHGGELTQALVMPGELSVGFGPKRRRGAWVFTYAPDAVIRMVARLFEALEDDRKTIADTIVYEALETALAMTRAMAAQRDVDLDVPAAKQRRGHPRWIAGTYQRLRVHHDARLWDFRDGKPIDWTQQENRWMHPRIDKLLAVAPDALDGQVREDDLFAVDDPVPPVSVAVPAGAVAGSAGPAEIDTDAIVADGAFVGPGCRVTAGSVIESGATVWNSVVDSSVIRSGSTVQRSTLQNATVGKASIVRSSRLIDSALGAQSTADAAALQSADIAAHTTINAFADLVDVVARYRSILGGAVHHGDIDTNAMLYHMAGWCEHVKMVPTMVEHDGAQVAVPAIPMLGGGCVIRGAADRPVELQGAFIGSNAVIEANTFVAFGCFILGTLGPDDGLLPFTVATGDIHTHAIGGVLTNLPSMAFTHFINWNFQLLDLSQGEVIAALALRCIEYGIAVIEAEQQRRAACEPFDPDGPVGRYRTLPRYTVAQLDAGLKTYRKMRDSGAWDMRFDGAELSFAAEKGNWIERNGSTVWQPNG